MDRFWELISRARGIDDPAAPSASPDAIRVVLESLTSDEVAGFLRQFFQHLIELNLWRLWGAGYVIAGGMSDDGFHYFRSWVIGKGKWVFDAALSDPDSLADFIDDPEVENETLEHVALEILEARGISSDPRDDVDGCPDDTPQGERFLEESVHEWFPRLAARG